MKKIEAGAPETQSGNIVAENVAQLKALFPEVLREGKIDFDVLKQLLGGEVDERDEKYGLNWHGKRRARQLALTPSTGTLRPCPEESVDWETTQNLIIEGDNLEVLKLLQKSYAGKVKLIYIDPPYNTGKDFVYPDDFRDNIKNYLELTGQVEGGRKISSNTETSGRFHTDWLNMMYPRLKLAHSLLRNDGAIFVSCDFREEHHLRIVMNEIFGEENFVAQIIWEKMYTTKNDASLVSSCHDLILCFARSSGSDVIGLLPRTEEMDARYSNIDNDARGDWKPIPLYADGERKNGRFKITSPTGAEFWPPDNCHWRYAEAEVLAMMADNRIWFGRKGDAQPNTKRFLSEMKEGVKSKTLWFHEEVGSNDSANRELRELMGENDSPFSFPKPVSLVSRIIQLGASPKDSLILDFFAGSGTTGHAVMEQNQNDQGNRRYILVQLPEPILETSKDQVVALSYCRKRSLEPNLAALTRERLKLAAAKLSVGATFSGDKGFRSLKLDTSNIQAWAPTREDIAASLDAAADHLRLDRTEQDILSELLLKLGLDLVVPIDEKPIAGKSVHSIGAGVLLVCLDNRIDGESAEPLALGIAAWHKELMPAGETAIVFRDSAFADDVAKTNLMAILQQHGLENVRSL